MKSAKRNQVVKSNIEELSLLLSERQILNDCEKLCIRGGDGDGGGDIIIIPPPPLGI